MTQLSLAQNMPTTNELINDLHSKGLAMRRGGAEHMIAHGNAHRSDDDDDDEKEGRSKKDQAQMELNFLRDLPKKTKHHLAKRLKHLQRQGALKV